MSFRRGLMDHVAEPGKYVESLQAENARLLSEVEKLGHEVGNMAKNSLMACQAAYREGMKEVLGIVAEEATRYSNAPESLVPAQIALVFANAVRSKTEASWSLIP
jgi:hypothetical protein